MFFGWRQNSKDEIIYVNQPIKGFVVGFHSIIHVLEKADATEGENATSGFFFQGSRK